MLRGNHPATVDGKFRIKIPAAFRDAIRGGYGNELFLTSFTGENVLVYPMPEWSAMEERFARIPTMNPARQKLLSRVNYYGLVTSMDKQGRVLVPQLLRENAKIEGEVVVMGQMTHLEVWNHDIYRTRLQASPLSDDDLQTLADLGV